MATSNLGEEDMILVGMSRGSVSPPSRQEIASEVAPELVSGTVPGAILETTPKEIQAVVLGTVPGVAPIKAPTVKVSPSEPVLRLTEGELEEEEKLERRRCRILTGKAVVTQTGKVKPPRPESRPFL